MAQLGEREGETIEIPITQPVQQPQRISEPGIAPAPLPELVPVTPAVPVPQEEPIPASVLARMPMWSSQFDEDDPDGEGEDFGSGE